MHRQTEIQTKIQKKSEDYDAQLRSDVETYFETRKKSLLDAADKRLQDLELELDSKLVDEIVQLKNKAKTTLLAAKEEADAHSLSLAIQTPKMAKPSSLNIKKPKKTRKKKSTVLNLTTPSPDTNTKMNPEMETDTDSTPTTPICRSSAPSPIPEILNLTEPTPPPVWARTASSDDRTPHAPSFPTTTPAAPAPAAPAITPVNPELAAIMAAISGMRTDLLDRIEKVNARVDLATGPQNIPDYMAWNEENPAAWEHPGYIDQTHADTMEALAEANAMKETQCLNDERFFCTLHTRFVAEQHMNSLEDNEVYLEKWYEVCTGIYKSMSWNITDTSPDMDDTIINAWRRAEEMLNEDEWKFSTYAIYECITGMKPNTSSPDGRSRFNTFTMAYNKFCAKQNFKTTEGFPETQDNFFKFYLANTPTHTAPTKPPTKSVRFTSAPLIATLPNPSASPPDEFPALQAPTTTPISYASATSAFIPVTRRQRGKQPANTTTTPMNQAAPKTTATTPGPKLGPKPLCPPKPPLPDALKTMKHTIILDHANPETRVKYSMDAREVTQGLQRHLEMVKAPLVLLARAWLTAPFYQNFILTFSSIVNFADITKYDSVLFGPFGTNCHAAPTAGYQSILISGVCLQRDATSKLASPKMLFDKLCCNLVFVGHLPLAAPLLPLLAQSNSKLKEKS